MLADYLDWDVVIGWPQPVVGIMIALPNWMHASTIFFAVTCFALLGIIGFGHLGDLIDREK